MKNHKFIPQKIYNQSGDWDESNLELEPKGTLGVTLHLLSKTGFLKSPRPPPPAPLFPKPQLDFCPSLRLNGTLKSFYINQPKK
jgi:hypothetical protein